jgi:hypothetical protein
MESGQKELVDQETHSRADAAPVTAAPETVLRKEARYLYRALFGGDPSPQIENGYVAAHRFYCTDNKDVPFMATVVERHLDVEALELVLRRSRPALTRKLRILVYLLEVTPSEYGRFINPTSRPWRGWASLIRGSVRTARKYAQGKAILRRHPELVSR